MTQRISTAQAARHYGIPARTIRRWHAEGRLTNPERRGRTLWWNIIELDAFPHLRALFGEGPIGARADALKALVERRRPQ